MDLAPGTWLGAYRLVELAGAGGMAEVWRAYQPRLDRFVAVKVLPGHFAAQPGYLERFEREARAASRLEHPNILPVHDFGEHDGQVYMVTPFVAGGTLAQRLGRPWSVAQALQVLGPLAAALDHAHAEGVVHRDVKPSNVLLSERGRVFLADFGVARLVQVDESLTGVGALVGTPAYMPPEQAAGRPASAASDLYSLGVIAYEMLTGRVPFDGPTPMAIALAHLQQPLPPPRAVNPALSDAADAILLRALAKEPADRYPSGSALIAAFGTVRSVASAAGPAPPAAWAPAPPGTPPPRGPGTPLPRGPGTPPPLTRDAPTSRGPGTPRPSRPGTPRPSGPSTPPPARAAVEAGRACSHSPLADPASPWPAPARSPRSRARKIASLLAVLLPIAFVAAMLLRPLFFGQPTSMTPARPTDLPGPTALPLGSPSPLPQPSLVLTPTAP